MQSIQGSAVNFAALGERLAGDVVVPEDESWDTSRQAWNLAVDQQPESG